jgi:Protein of unknown function (DUF2484)
MSWSLILGCLWAIAATITALLPMRRQYPPGIALLVAAPALIAVIWVEHGWMFGLPALLGFLSMFRNPLRYFIKKWLGYRVELPKELHDRMKK